jgi:hypothetical protein
MGRLQTNPERARPSWWPTAGAPFPSTASEGTTAELPLGTVTHLFQRHRGLDSSPALSATPPKRC